jgi:hypothetical protein
MVCRLDAEGFTPSKSSSLSNENILQALFVLQGLLLLLLFYFYNLEPYETFCNINVCCLKVTLYFLIICFVVILVLMKFEAYAVICPVSICFFGYLVTGFNL